jgi:RND family efflux transporter MFP subunit
MPHKHYPQKTWLIRIWGLIPKIILFVLCIAVVWMYQTVQAKKEILEAEKAAQMKKEQPATNVMTLELNPHIIRDRITFPGVIKAWVQLDVLSEVQGKLIDISIKEGDVVKKGQLLAKIDPRDYKNAFLSIKATYKAALASVKRLKELYQKQLATQSQLDDAIAQMEIAKANMDTSSLNLERCAIRAPISGIVNSRYVDKGQYINLSEKIIEIIQMDKVKAVVGIPESDVDAVRTLKHFNVTIDALNKSFQASRYFLSKTADTTARLYNLEMTIHNADYQILPDMFVRVEIVKREIENGIIAPLYSILTRNNQRLAFIEREGHAHVCQVELGLQEKWHIEIKKGLNIGDRLIVMGHRDVSDGQPVNVIRTIRTIEELEK